MLIGSGNCFVLHQDAAMERTAERTIERTEEALMECARKSRFNEENCCSGRQGVPKGDQ
jgi:hypothetical protein